MPMTLPAHAAAVLPLMRVRGSWVQPAALVVGACAPDFAYVLRLRGALSHSLPGLFVFCVPAGLVLLAWLEGLVLPVLRRVLPRAGGVEWTRFLRTGGLPGSARAWASAALCILLGAITHLVWDGFTHLTMWPAAAFYQGVTLPVAGRMLPLARVLQYLSSILGSALVLLVMMRRYPALPPSPTGAWRAFLPVLVPTLIGAALGMSTRLLVHHRHLHSLEARLFFAFWPAVAGAMVGLTLGCLLARLATPPPPRAAAASSRPASSPR